MLLRQSLLLLVTLMSLSISLSSLAQTKTASINSKQHPENLDWLPDTNNKICAGRYLEPNLPNSSKDTSSTNLHINAGKSSTKIGQFAQFSQGVHLRQGSKSIWAEKAKLDQQKNIAYLKNNVVYREPGLLFKTETADIDLNSTSGVFNKAEFVLHAEHLRGSAEVINRLSNDQTELQQSSYTYCPPGDTSWQLVADNIVLDQKTGFGTAKHARLEIADMPILYLPIITFPIDDHRKSGFLYPIISYSKTGGLNLAAPYYFNLAENYDDTLTPRVITKRGVMLENEFRYLGQNFKTNVNAAFLPNDNVKNADRWLLNLKQSGYQSGLSSSIDYNSVSDKDYFKDLTTNLEVQRDSKLDQKAEIQYQGNNWKALARAHGYQNISDVIAPYERLPQLQFSSKNKWGNTSIKQLSEYTYFERDTYKLTGTDKITGSRIHFQPSIKHKFSRSYGYIKPQLSLWHNSYKLKSQLAGRAEDPNYSIPIASIDSALFLERPFANSIQTLEPRLFLLSIPREQQTDVPNFDTTEFDFDYLSLFRENRFSGQDRLNDTQQASLGLTTRFLNKNGSEYLSASIAQAFYFTNRYTQLNTYQKNSDKRSDIATQINWRLSDKIRLVLDNILADKNVHLKKTGLKAEYTESYNKQFSVALRHEKHKREQIDTQIIWPITYKTAAIGRWQYDIKNNKDLERILGIEYESCCWKLQLYTRRSLDKGKVNSTDFNEGIYIRFLLKGLGAINSSSTSFLNDITGFKTREEKYDF